MSYLIVKYKENIGSDSHQWPCAPLSLFEAALPLNMPALALAWRWPCRCQETGVPRSVWNGMCCWFSCLPSQRWLWWVLLCHQFLPYCIRCEGAGAEFKISPWIKRTCSECWGVLRGVIKKPHVAFFFFMHLSDASVISATKVSFFLLIATCFQCLAWSICTFSHFVMIVKLEGNK